MSKHDLTRRAFLASATTTALVAGVARANTARVVPRKLSPNDKVNVAAIGAGGKGSDDILSCHRLKENVNVVALCDVDWSQTEETFYRIPGAKQYKDYRKMLEEMGGEIDACTISTPDHTHAPAGYLAMNLGKHVYIQKPLAHTIAEARLLRETAKKAGVITQMGNQGHCGNGVRDLCEMMWAGAIGDVTEAHIWTNRPVWPQGITEPLAGEPVPDTMDWDLWTGTAPERPYNKGYAPFKWRGWWDFGCGAIGDMACHIMDPAFWSLKLGDAATFTVQTVSQEGMSAQTAPLKSVIKFTFPARADMQPVTVYWHDGGDQPPRPEGVPAEEKLGDGENGSLFIGTKGFITAGEYGGGARLLPEAVMKDYTKPDRTIERIKGQSPYKNWIDGILTGKPCASNFDYAGPLTEVANFGNIALHANGEAVTYDVASMKITSNPALNTLLTKEYRKGWELPC